MLENENINEPHKSPFLVGAISGSIIVNKHTSERQRHISSTSNFFNGEIIVKIDNDKISFRKTTIDYEGRRYSFYKDKSGRFHSAVICELPLGKFYIDEEDSDEDCIVVYYHH